MKRCKTCTNMIEERYIVCAECASGNAKLAAKATSAEQEILKTLQHINWNLGNIAKAAMKLAKTEPLERPKQN